MTTTTIDLTLGRRVRATDTLVRRTSFDGSGATAVDHKQWVRAGEKHPTEYLNKAVPVEGVVAGVRTLHETGRSVFFGGDEPSVWRPESYRTAVLIAHDLRKKPAMAWVDDVELVPEPQAPASFATAVAQLRWLAEARDQYEHPEVQRQTHTARHLADILEGDNLRATGWLPSWEWERWASMRTNPAGAPSITVPRPHVPFGPQGVPEHLADAQYLEAAADHIEGGYKVGGSNLTATVIALLRDAAAALRTQGGPS